MAKTGGVGLHRVFRERRVTLPALDQHRQHGALDLGQRAVLAFDFAPDAVTKALRAALEQLAQAGGLAQFQRDLADDALEHLGPVSDQLEGGKDVVFLELVVGRQVLVDPRGIGRHIGAAQQGKVGHARAEERLRAVEQQVGELVAVRARKDQEQARRFYTLVHLVARGLERKHGIGARLGGQRVLRLVDDQHDRPLHCLVEHIQRISQGNAGRQPDLAQVEGEGAQYLHLLHAGLLGQLGDRSVEFRQLRLDGVGNQMAGVAGAVGPEVDIDGDPLAALDFGHEVFAQERAFAGAPGCRQE